MTLPTVLYVACGGAIGASLRWYVGGFMIRQFGTHFPWGTFAVNVIGSFIMGIMAVWIMEKTHMHRAIFNPLIMTGMLGGFTTFSAFSLDTLYLIERGKAAAAAAYISGSVVLSVLALTAGLHLARTMFTS